MEHFLTGEVPIRDFYYPYAPLMMPAILPFYLLAGHTIAGISLFAICAEAVALWFFLKSASLAVSEQKMDPWWLREAMALYLLNPATLYWTVFQGYHSIVQTAYTMAGIYLLLRGYLCLGYATGLFSLAGAKFIAILDWPALLAARRPNFLKLILGAAPTLLVYAVYQVITGDVLFPVRYHIAYMGEGNRWYLLTLFGDFHRWYSSFPGKLLPVVCFGTFFVLGLGIWSLRALRGSTGFSFATAAATMTFATSLFLIFSFYTGAYYYNAPQKLDRQLRCKIAAEFWGDKCQNNGSGTTQQSKRRLHWKP